jgi:hypothetical protein
MNASIIELSFNISTAGMTQTEKIDSLIDYIADLSKKEQKAKDETLRTLYYTEKIAAKSILSQLVSK